jgi:hypothetical protein
MTLETPFWCFNDYRALNIGQMLSQYLVYPPGGYEESSTAIPAFKA